MKSRFFASLLCLGAGLLVLPGCGVYIPHVPATPVLTAGQLEVKVAVAPLMSANTATMKPKSGPWVPATEGYVAFSPIKHVFGVIAGGGNFIGPVRSGASEYIRDRQADIGLGCYWRLGTQEQGYLAGSVGMGRGQYEEVTLESYTSVISIYGGRINDYHRTQARYRRQYAQAHCSWPINDWITVCGFARVSRIDFDNLADGRSGDGVFWHIDQLPVTTAAWYFEPGWSMRFGKGAFQGVMESPWSAHLYGPKIAGHATILNTLNTSFLTLGVIYRPQLFSRL